MKLGEAGARHAEKSSTRSVQQFLDWSRTISTNVFDDDSFSSLLKVFRPGTIENEKVRKPNV